MRGGRERRLHDASSLLRFRSVSTVVTEGEQAPAAAQPDLPATVRAVAATHELAPGEQLIIKKDGTAQPRQNVSLEQVTAWRRGKIILQDEPLSEACVRMNRYSRIKIVIQDKAVASLGVSGVFEAGDTGAFAEALESLFGIRALRIGNGLDPACAGRVGAAVVNHAGVLKPRYRCAKRMRFSVTMTNRPATRSE